MWLNPIPSPIITIMFFGTGNFRQVCDQTAKCGMINRKASKKLKRLLTIIVLVLGFHLLFPLFQICFTLHEFEKVLKLVMTRYNPDA